MTEVQPVRSIPAAPARVRGWAALLPAAIRDLGVLPPEWLARWRAELDAVRAGVAALERSAPEEAGLPAGLHALVTITTAQAGDPGSIEHVRVAATAVELAYRATLHHAAVLDDAPGAGHGLENRRHVLDGDWSITQAAVLVAGIGPSAYQVLVRGYGVVQVASLRDAEPGGGSRAGLETSAQMPAPVAGSPLLATAAALGSLLAVGRTVHAEAARVAAWAGAGGPVGVRSR